MSAWHVCLSRTDNYSIVDGLQLDRPPMLGSVSVKTIVVLPSRSAAGVVQFAAANNITGLSPYNSRSLYHLTSFFRHHLRFIPDDDDAVDDALTVLTISHLALLLTLVLTIGICNNKDV